MPWTEDGSQAAADARLADWPADEPLERDFAHWLRTQADPDGRHRVADAWNWDQGNTVLWWIVTRPDCDRATALLVLWRSFPLDALGAEAAALAAIGPAHDDDATGLLAGIRRRLLDGAYPRAELAFDPAEEIAMLEQHAALAAPPIDRQALERLIPPDLWQPQPGREPTGERLIEGIPARFWPPHLAVG